MSAFLFASARAFTRFEHVSVGRTGGREHESMVPLVYPQQEPRLTDRQTQESCSADY